MIDHHIQKTIVYKLALTEGMRFSELKPDTIDNKLFDYHLKKTLSTGLVEKDENGIYKLTSKGRLLGLRALENSNQIIDKAESVMFLVIQQGNNWLMYRRKSFPLRNKIGFMHATPTSRESLPDASSRVCLEKTGLSCKFTPLGGGFFRTYEGEELESFTHFTMLYATEVSGELQQSDNLADYFWVEDPDFNDPEMLPNMQTLSEKYLSKEPFFIERDFSLN